MSNETKYKDMASREKIKSLLDCGVKTAYVRDGAGRVESLYEAPLTSDIGEPCLLTQFKYADGAAGTSRQVVATIESVTSWLGFEVVQVGAGDDFTALI